MGCATPACTNFDRWASAYSPSMRVRLRASDMALVESILLRANIWAHVDWLAATVAGALVRRYASTKKRLNRWAKHENLWVRRASMLALLEDLPAGEGDFEAFEPLRGADVVRARVLHSQGDRMGPAGGRKEAARADGGFRAPAW